jgi:hypothetical protein
MLNVTVLWIRFILLIFSGQKQVALENVALRQQLAVFKCDVRRPKLNGHDRLFWVGLLDDLAGLKIGIGNRAAGNGNFVAPQSFQTVLVEAIPT